MILIGLVAESQEDPKKKKKGIVFSDFLEIQQKLILSLLAEIGYLSMVIVYIALHWLK